VRTLVDVAQRLAALACLVSAYYWAESGFYERTWLNALLVAALFVATAAPRWTSSGDDLPRLGWPRRRQLAAALLPGWLLMLGAAAGKLAGLDPHVATWTWFAGAGWLLLGAWQASAPLPRVRTPAAVWFWTVVVLAVAIGLRAWRIDSIPRYVHHDEAVMSQAGLRYLVDGLDWFTVKRDDGNFTNMPLAFIPAGIGPWIGGFNLVWARLMDVLLGVLSVWLLFDGTRRVATLPLAVVAALLLAANHTHIAYSRIASTYMHVGFLVSLLFWLLSKLWTRPNYLQAALLGLVGVLGMQTYHASFATFPLLIVVVLGLAVVQWRRWRAIAAPLAIGAITALCAAGIFAVAVWQARDLMFTRNREVSIYAPGHMADLQRFYGTDSAATVTLYQVGRGLAAFNVGRDMCEQYMIDRPLADPYTAALLVAGAVLALSRWRDFITLNAVVVTAGYLILGIALQVTTCHNRVVGALPLGMLLPAIAIVQCTSVLWAGQLALWGWLRTLSMAGLTVGCATASALTYFVYYSGAMGYSTDHAEAAWLARDYADRYTVHLVSWSFKYGPWDSQRLILADTPVDRNDRDSDDAYIRDVQLTGSDLFIVSGFSPQSRDALLARFPQARAESVRRDRAGSPETFLVFVGQPR
jgi:4-amino-4-deoxy-L-arabinose transferase-like glycosyltransferase